MSEREAVDDGLMRAANIAICIILGPKESTVVEVCTARDRDGDVLSFESREVDEEQITRKIADNLRKRKSWSLDEILCRDTEEMETEDQLRLSILHQHFRKALIDSIDRPCPASHEAIGKIIEAIVMLGWRQEAINQCARVA